MEPKLSYFILCSHRSGSGLLCEILARCGVGGRPGEFFIHWNGMAHKNWDISDYPVYVRRVIDDTMTENGVFGAKVMTGMVGGLEGMVAEFRKHPDYANTPLDELFAEFFPNLKFVYLMRRNKVAQAVSWWKAVQNEQYHIIGDDEPSNKEVEYNPEAISTLVTEIIMEEASHQEFLTRMGAIPHVVVYEDFIQQMPETIAGVLEFLGITETPKPFTTPAFRKQADALSDEWVERFRQEKMENEIHPRWTAWLREPVNE